MSTARDAAAAAAKDAVSCVDAFNALFYCASPGHQFDRYYKDGGADGCGTPMKEMRFCLELKMAGPEATRVRTCMCVCAPLHALTPRASRSQKLVATLLAEDKPPPSTVWEMRR
jgi:hypothetical protein